jgi:two-component sensor histidine kinase
MGSAVELSGRHKNGTELPIEISLSSMKTEDGILRMSAIRDVTERREARNTLLKQAEDLRNQRATAVGLAREAQDARQEAEAAEDRASASLREKEVLLQEVHHRVKNNLQVVSSLINMQLRQIGEGASRGALEQCQQRVQAMALIHEKLYQSKDYARVPFAEYVRSLAADVFQATGVSPQGIVLELAIEDLPLAVEKAIPCGLILNELITNALEHAFPNERAGKIRIELARVDVGRIRLAVSDDGVGLPPGLDARMSGSLGLELVRMLAKQVDAELEVSGVGGTSVRLTVPVGE